jgi:hypothetical protein
MFFAVCTDSILMEYLKRWQLNQNNHMDNDGVWLQCGHLSEFNAIRISPLSRDDNAGTDAE